MKIKLDKVKIINVCIFNVYKNISILAPPAAGGCHQAVQLLRGVRRLRQVDPRQGEDAALRRRRRQRRQREEEV